MVGSKVKGQADGAAIHFAFFIACFSFFILANDARWAE
jgi:hypothetical protein